MIVPDKECDCLEDLATSSKGGRKTVWRSTALEMVVDMVEGYAEEERGSQRWRRLSLKVAKRAGSDARWLCEPGEDVSG